MGEMDLIYLVVGVGLGLLGSRFIRSTKEPKEPVVSTSINQPEEPMVSTSIKQLEEPMVSTSSEPQGTDQENLQPLKEELKQTQLAYQMAQQISQFKGGFLARTSHELRSPLSSLIGMHQLILNDLCDSPEEEREFVAQANDSAKKMVKLLDELIAVAKMEHGKTRLETRSLPLTKVFEDVHTLTHMQAANNNLQLEIVPPETEIYVLADSRRFQQVLVGLIDSAISQMEVRKEGSIRVWAACSTESPQAHIWIDVQTPASIWSEAVDLFSRAPDEIQTQPDETSKISPGLTLFMVQTLIEVMNGRLDVLSVSSGDPTSDSQENSIRLQCSMPLGTPEPVEQGLEVG